MGQMIASIRKTSHFDTHKTLFALLSLYFIWGSTYLAMDIALASFPPFTLVALRFSLAGVLLFIIAFASGEKLPNFRLAANAALIGCLTMGVGTSSVAIAVQWVSTGLAALAIAAVPLWAGIFAALLLKRPSGRDWLGLVIGFAGIILLNMESSFQAEPLGAIVLIIGPVSWAFGSILSQRIQLPSGWMAVAFETIGAALLITILRFALGEGMNSAATVQTVSALLYLAVIGTVIGFSAYMYLLRTVSSSLATSYAYINPVVAVLLGIVFIGESITTTALVAMAVIITGVVIVVTTRSKN